MSKSAFSLQVFAVYLFLVGTVLVVAPNFLLGLFGLPEAQEVWVRVVGMLALILGYYYSVAAKNELTPFIRASVYGRCSVILFFAVFVGDSGDGAAPKVVVLVDLHVREDPFRRLRIPEPPGPLGLPDRVGKPEQHRNQDLLRLYPR